MKNFNTSVLTVAVILLSSVSSLFSQEIVPFVIRHQSTIKGDMTVIANNIVNRIDYDNTANQALYNTSNQSMLNDDYIMGYIDIDEDENTFSSSNAELTLTNPKNKKVVYAGLYWSATYKYNSGTKKSETKFMAIDDKREAFNTIKIKLPTHDDYTSVTGEIVFDGNTNKEFKDSSPYVAYADITNLVSELYDPNGVYTIANVRATEGTLSGGTSAGWTIFFVYEDDTMSEKHITSMDGFNALSSKPIDLKFKDFVAPAEGQVKAKVAFASLEGDLNLNNDQLLVGSEGKEFIVLSENKRKTTNFFNSSITVDGANFDKRFPDSKNTLGYDTSLMTIPNDNNAVIANQSKEATMRLVTTGDKSFMFFSAFNVETQKSVDAVADTDYSVKNVINNMMALNDKENKIVYKKATDEMVRDENDTFTATNLSKRNYALETKMVPLHKKDIEIQMETITDLNKGFFIIAGVYSDPFFANNSIAELKQKGIEANYFVNPLNNYRYVYLNKTDSQEDAVALYLSSNNNTYKEQTWILAVNNNKNLDATIFNNSMLAESED